MNKAESAHCLPYDFRSVETRWQRLWNNEHAFSTARTRKAKYFVCDFLPTPNGPLHMGHTLVYTLGDICARYKRHRGYNVLHPQAFDSFGLPLEIESVNRGIHPLRLSMHYSQVMLSQLRKMGYATSYGSIFSMCEPRIYKWTQYIFSLLLEHDLAYRAEGVINYCPQCNTSLAFEQVETGRCWRCETSVGSKIIPQWYYRITRFAADLLEGLESLPNWPKHMKAMQRNWIGRSEGVSVQFTLSDGSDTIQTFTTRHEALFGTTFIAVSAHHPIARRALGANELRTFLSYESGAIDRKGKPGKRVALEATHPYTGELLPVYVASYVQDRYGSGAVAGVPGHDIRDAEFAEIHNLPTKWLSSGPALHSRTRRPVLELNGLLSNSGSFSGSSMSAARAAITIDLEKRGIGRAEVQYRLRDWCVSRQRYWGTPIPVVYCERCMTVPVPRDDLPVLLPLDVTPTFVDNPLRSKKEFITCTCPNCGRLAQRETDTLDTYCDSAWYIFRCCSPEFAQSSFETASVKSWMPIDMGVGGVDSINFLLYTRFMSKALQSIGMVPVKEPIEGLLIQCPILHQGKKMGKRTRNVIAPDQILDSHGADVLRLFVTRLQSSRHPVEWKENHLASCVQFVKKLWSMAERNVPFIEESVRGDRFYGERRRISSDLSKTINLVTSAYEKRQYNSVLHLIYKCVDEILCFEKNINELGEGKPTQSRRVVAAWVLTVCQLLYPIVPHITQEIWDTAGRKGRIDDSEWPRAEDWICPTSLITVVVQVEGIKEYELQVPSDMAEFHIVQKAKAWLHLHDEHRTNWVNKVYYHRGKVCDVVNFTAA